MVTLLVSVFRSLHTFGLRLQFIDRFGLRALDLTIALRSTTSGQYSVLPTAFCFCPCLLSMVVWYALCVTYITVSVCPTPRHLGLDPASTRGYMSGPVSEPASGSVSERCRSPSISSFFLPQMQPHALLLGRTTWN